MFGIKQDKDIVHLIETAVSIVALVAPEKLKNHRSRIIKLLFDEDPALFSDDEFFFEDDDRRVSLPPNNVSKSQEVKKGVELSEIQPFNKGFKRAVELSQIQPVKKGFEKAVELSLSQLATPSMPSKAEKIADDVGTDYLIKSKFERTKTMLERMCHEEAEKKAKRKIQCVDFPEPKKHCGDARQRICSRMEKMKARHAKPKYNLHSGLMLTN